MLVISLDVTAQKAAEAELAAARIQLLRSVASIYETTLRTLAYWKLATDTTSFYGSRTVQRSWVASCCTQSTLGWIACHLVPARPLSADWQASLLRRWLHRRQNEELRANEEIILSEKVRLDSCCIELSG